MNKTRMTILELDIQCLDEVLSSPFLSEKQRLATTEQRRGLKKELQELSHNENTVDSNRPVSEFLTEKSMETK